MLRVATLILTLGLPSVAAAQSADVSLDAESLQLDAVADRTELAFEERPAYFGILDHVRRVPPGELNAAAAAFVHDRWQQSRELHTPEAADFPLFADMLKHPDAYRGQPVAVQGHAIKSVKYAANNDYGLDPLYEIWLVTSDSQQHPTTVICTELPPGFPLGEDLVDGVSVAGYFLKLHLYPSQDRKGRVAPLILARTVAVNEPAAVRFPIPVPVIYAGVLILMAALVFFTWRASRGDRAFQAQRRARLNEPKPEDLAGLESIDRPLAPPAPPFE